MARVGTFVALLVAFVVFGNGLVGLLGGSPDLVLLWMALAVLGALVGTLAVEGRDGRTRSGSIWEFIPNEQYEGRFAEAGGIARGEQEEELDRIRKQASQRRE